MRRFLSSFLAGGILVAFLWLLSGLARAHDARAGWTYPMSCCGQGDCAEISPRSVKVTPQGFEIAIRPGEHPQWRADRPTDFHAFVFHEDAKPSPDGEYHLCILPYTDPPRAGCFWFGALGS